MTTTQAPETDEELQEQLEVVIRSAESNGLDIEGGYEFRTADHRSDWDMEIVEVAKRGDLIEA